MTSVLLIRHGQARFGADDYDCLSTLGERQSRLLGDWLHQCGHAPKRVVVGPMLRHQQTASACLGAIACASSMPWETLAGLAEFDHVDVIARHRPDCAQPSALRAVLAHAADPQAEFHALFSAAMQRWRDDCSGDYAESWGAFKRRSIDALGEVIAGAGRGPAWVFTSGGPIAVILQHLLDMPDARLLAMNGVLANTGITRLRVRDGKADVASFNAVPHLEAGGDASLVSYR